MAHEHSLDRRSGILLHPTCLPSPYGIGDLGPNANAFADFLVEAGQTLWQVLPLGPTGYGDSPYQTFSIFAGNPLLISPELLFEDGLLTRAELEGKPQFPERTVDYGGVLTWKRELIRRAYGNFCERASDEEKGLFDTFRDGQSCWLEDYSLFMALKLANDGASWTEWEEGVRLRKRGKLNEARKALKHEIEVVDFGQYLFFKQWNALREYCNERGIQIIGDMPIYAAHDSADVWANRSLFKLDSNGHPTVVAGVPPDYFSETGQLWGNPIYRWKKMANDEFSWWVDRLTSAIKLYDLVRIDHFRGFAGYWEVPAGEETAENGRWVEGPGEALFEALAKEFGDDLPIIAEDLGIITEDVVELRNRFDLPGMAVLQFGFGKDANSSHFPPHKFRKNLVAYSGTHDNDTILGWWVELYENDPEMRTYLQKYFATDGWEFQWTAIQALMASVANTVIFPLQDVLGLGSEGRMNTPGNAVGNWTWRYVQGDLTPDLIFRLRKLTEVYGRLQSPSPTSSPAP